MGRSKIFKADGTLRGNTSASPPPTTAVALVDEYAAAAILGLSVRTLRRWRWARRDVPWIKIGAAVRYDPKDLSEAISAGRVSPEANAS